MGAWGTGIYSNDIAQEVKSVCQEIYPYVTIETGNQIVLNLFRDIWDIQIPDNECVCFWYAFADWQWRHGILSADIREKVIHMLSNYIGIGEWSGCVESIEVKKRIAVLDELKLRLESQMPLPKLKKGKLKKPKHKIGDVLVFRSCSQAKCKSLDVWKIEDLDPPIMLKEFSDVTLEAMPPFDAHGKYMAGFCVDYAKVLHSEYIPDLYDEYSVYVFYDYLSDVRPTLAELNQCGFLPQLDWTFKDFNEKITETIGWSYVFTLQNESFRATGNSAITEIEKHTSYGEVARFQNLVAYKDYRNKVIRSYYWYDAFPECWQIKVLMERLGATYDNLLMENICNPELLTPKELNVVCRKYFKSGT